jgi:hypothetical protein
MAAVSAALTVAGMKPNRTSVKFAAALVASGMAAAATAAWGSGEPASADSAPMKLRAVFDAGSSAEIDIGRKGESAGDYVVGAADLERAGKPFGRLEIVDYALDERYEGSMKLGTMFLPRGMLALQGGGFNRRVPGARSPAVEELAVVGGTGAYRSAHGIVEVRPSKDGNARLIVRVKG